MLWRTFGFNRLKRYVTSTLTRLDLALPSSERASRARRVSSRFQDATVLFFFSPGSTPAATSGDEVIAALTHGDASFSWEVAQETGEEQREEGDGGPADTAAWLPAGEGLVCARVLVVAGAVVEQPLDAADAGAVLHRGLNRAQASAATYQAGRKGPLALRAAALAAVLALGVPVLVLRDFGATQGRHQLGVIAQRFQLLWT